MSYQVRISYKTAELLEELKYIYENQEKVPITKGEVLIRSYYDSQWVKNWQDIYKEKIIIKNNYEIKENALRPRLQITNEVEQGIKDLKIKIADIMGLRSVTLGVVVNLILKASYIKNNSGKINSALTQSELIQEVFSRYKLQVTNELDDEFKNSVLVILNSLEKEINEYLN